MARRSKVLDNLSNVISDEYIINENEIESVNVLLLRFFSMTESGCKVRFYDSSDVIEIPKNKLPKGAGVDSVLRYVDGKYIFDEKATKEVFQQMAQMVDKLLEEQTQILKQWRQEGHTYVVTENTGDKVWLFDETIDSQNGECIDDIEFPKELMNIAKEGTRFKYINGKYVN